MKRLRLLMVEDEIGFSSCYADWLRETGIVFDTAETVDSAVERIAGYDYDVAIIDYHIGDHLGTEVLSRTAHLPKAAKLRCYAMTGDARLEVIGNLIAAGFIDVLVKPFRHSKFVELLKDEAGRNPSPCDEEIKDS